MIDKLSPNQRLMLAVVLSIVFFVAYTAIFPPEQKIEEVKKSQPIEKKVDAEVSVEDVAGHSISEAEKVQSTISSTIVTVKNEHFILKIDTLGRISSMELLEDKYKNKDGGNAQLISPNGVKPLYIRFLDEELNKEATKTSYISTTRDIEISNKPSKIVLTQKLSSVTVTKELTIYPDGHYDAKVSLSDDKRYFIYLGQRPKVNEEEKTIVVKGAMVYTDDDLITIIEDGDAEGRKTFSGVQLISAFDQYSANIIYGLSNDINVIVERDRNDNPIIYFDAHKNMSFSGYVGEKNYKTLKNIDPILTNAIEYGWFTFASKPIFALLSWLHGMLGNWGWAIIGLTILIRLVLYPLTYKGMMSMQKIKEISPKIKELQAKYKGDPQRMNAAVMDMYKKHNANPLGGCLPMILQIPVFFAIYRVLLNAVELQGSEWIFWINDLSRMDSTFVLPILMGASMYFQQRMTPSNFTDPMQEKVFKFLPIIFTFFFVTFPSGLVLYWFVNNLFSILQQYIVNIQFQNAKDAQIAKAKHKVENKDD